MIDRNSKSNTSDSEYECIDPELGKELWRIDDPNSPVTTKARLQAHLEYCPHCRTLEVMKGRLASGLERGQLEITESESRQPMHLNSKWAAWVGAAAVAATLALVFLQAPNARQNGLILRGGDGSAVLRPAPDEIIAGSTPVIRWKPVTGANSYQVRVSAVENEYVWSDVVSNAETRIPRDHSLPPNSRFRIRVQPVPTHLTGPNGFYSSFRTGSLAEFVAYRWHVRSLMAKFSGWLGLGSLALALLGPLGLRLRK